MLVRGFLRSGDDEAPVPSSCGLLPRAAQSADAATQVPEAEAHQGIEAAAGESSRAVHASSTLIPSKSVMVEPWRRTLSVSALCRLKPWQGGHAPATVLGDDKSEYRCSAPSG